VSPAPDDRIARARQITRLLDSALLVPGTGIRFGLDPLIGLVPGLGDVAGAVLSGYIVLLAADLGAPPVIVLRMLANIAIDTFGGAVPVLGDAFDFVWKSNTRNLALLERFVARPAATHAASRLIVGGTIAALALLTVGGVALTVMVVRALMAAIR
jgi:hypothetical protein